MWFFSIVVSSYVVVLLFPTVRYRHAAVFAVELKMGSACLLLAVAGLPPLHSTERTVYMSGSETVEVPGSRRGPLAALSAQQSVTAPEFNPRSFVPRHLRVGEPPHTCGAAAVERDWDGDPPSRPGMRERDHTLSETGPHALRAVD